MALQRTQHAASAAPLIYAVEAAVAAPPREDSAAAASAALFECAAAAAPVTESAKAATARQLQKMDQEPLLEAVGLDAQQPRQQQPVSACCDDSLKQQEQQLQLEQQERQQHQHHVTGNTLPNQAHGMERKERFMSAVKVTFYEVVLKQLLDDGLLETAHSLALTLHLRSKAPIPPNHLFNIYRCISFCSPSIFEAAFFQDTAGATAEEEKRKQQQHGGSSISPMTSSYQQDDAGNSTNSFFKPASSADAAAAAAAETVNGETDGECVAPVGAPAEQRRQRQQQQFFKNDEHTWKGKTVLPFSFYKDSNSSVLLQQWTPLQTRCGLPAPRSCDIVDVELLNYAAISSATTAASLHTVAFQTEQHMRDSVKEEIHRYRQHQPQQPQGQNQLQQLQQVEERERESTATERKIRCYEDESLSVTLTETIRQTLPFKGCLSVACNADARLVAGGGMDGVVRVLEFPRSSLRDTLAPAAVTATAATARSVRIRAYQGHAGPVTCLAFHPRREIGFSGSVDCSVKVFDVGRNAKNSTAAMPFTATLQDVYPVNCLAMHACGDFLYVGTSHPIIRLYDLQTRRCFTSLSASSHQQEAINSLCCTNDGSILASASADGSIHFFDAGAGKLVNSLKFAHSGMPVTSVCWSRSARYLLSSGLDGQTRIWDVRNGKQIIVMGEGRRYETSKVASVFLSHEKNIAIISTDTIGGLQYYNAYTGSQIPRKSVATEGYLKDLEAAPFKMGMIVADIDTGARFIDIDESGSNEGSNMLYVEAANAVQDRQI